MASLPQDADAGSSVGGGGPPPAVWWSAASPVGGDVVLSAAVLLFLAVAFGFVVYHYFTIGLGPRRGAAQRQRATARGGGGAAAGARGGVDAELLRALPVTVYRAAKDRTPGEALECAVCLGELADGEAARFLPRCGHGFHAECVDMWLRGHPTCPLCRVEVDKTGSVFAPSSLALPPALPEPANYPMNLPTNVLFWGSQDTVTTTTVGRGPAPSRGAAAAALVIEVRETAPAAAEPTPTGGGDDAAKVQGLARLRSLGRHDVAAASSRSCRHATAAAPPLDIWNLT